MAGNHTRLSAGKFGFATGLVWGLGMFVTALLGMWSHYGLLFIKVMGSLYWKFAATWSGAFWGLLWGFIDFFIFGFLVALVYNWCKGRCHKSSESA